MVSDSEDIGRIRDWMRHPITGLFMNRLREIKEENDISVHEAIAKNNFQEAANYNASCLTLQSVLDLPNEMIEECEEEKE